MKVGELKKLIYELGRNFALEKDSDEVISQVSRLGTVLIVELIDLIYNYPI